MTTMKSGVIITVSSKHDVAYISAVTEAEQKSEF